MNPLRIVSTQIILIQYGILNNIEMSKQKDYSKFSRKLATNKINPKYYWSILKSFLNKKNPCIHLSINNNQFVAELKEKKGIN